MDIIIITNIIINMDNLSFLLTIKEKIKQNRTIKMNTIIKIIITMMDIMTTMIITTEVSKKIRKKIMVGIINIKYNYYILLIKLIK